MNQVIHGDCLEVMPTLPDKSIDMILCDLPYGTTDCKWDSIIPFEPLWKEYKRVIKDNGAIVLTASQPFTSALVMSNTDMFRYEWIWDKTQGANFLMANKQPLRTHENVVVFSKNQTYYNPIMTKADMDKIRPISDGAKTNITGQIQKHSKNYDVNKRYPKSIIKESANQRECNKLNRVHPTQKPVALFEYLIKTYTNEGEMVLDNCAGSGTTAIACLNTNRKYILIEKEKEYIDITNKRIAEHEQQLVIGGI